MKLSKVKGTEYIYFFLSVINTILCLQYGINVMTYIIFAFIFVGLCTKTIDCETFFLYTLFIPNKYLQILTIPVYLFVKGKLFKPRFTRNTILFLGLIAFSGIINCIVYRGFVPAVIFQIGFYYCILLLIEQFTRKIDVRLYIDFFDDIFVLQIICALIEIIVKHAFKDNVRGTFESAHYFGVFLLTYLYMLYKVKNKKRKPYETGIRFITGTIILILADAKHVLLVVAISIIIAWILNKLHVKKQIFFVGMMLLIGIILFITFVQSGIGHTLIKGETMKTYLYNDKYNKKYVYMVNTYEEMQSINGLIGFGVGQYGSQISLTMSKGIIYDWNPHLASYKYAINPYKRAISGLMTEWYINTGIGISSMVLGYPLVSFVGMIAELGLLGFLLFCGILDKRYEGKNKLFIIAFLLLTIFDTYLEIVCVFVLILFVTNVYQKKGKIVIK